jgi:hypothetical protein
MWRFAQAPPRKPSVAIRRRPSDFSGRGPVLLQMGTTTCCCCCCLHWVAAAAGGTAGAVVAWRADKKKPDSPVHPVAREYGTAILITLAVVAVDVGQTSSTSEVLQSMLLVLAFVPSLAFLPVGAAAMAGAALARLEARQMPDPAERRRMAAGMGLAWRIAWKSFLLSSFFSGFGYLIMYIYALMVS